MPDTFANIRAASIKRDPFETYDEFIKRRLLARRRVKLVEIQDVLWHMSTLLHESATDGEHAAASVVSLRAVSLLADLVADLVYSDI